MNNNRLAKEQLKPLNGLNKIRKWIEDRGLKRAAVTNAPRPNAELMISLLGLSDFFHAVVLGSDCDRAKPFPDPYLKALEVLQVSKDHTFIFEVLLCAPIIAGCSRFKQVHTKLLTMTGFGWLGFCFGD